MLEDSPNGVQAGVAAGMNVVAVATPFTVAGLHSGQLLDHHWVVHEPEKLVEVCKRPNRRTQPPGPLIKSVYQNSQTWLDGLTTSGKSLILS